MIESAARPESAPTAYIYFNSHSRDTIMSSAGSSADSGATAAAPGGQRLVGVHSSVIVHPLVLLSVVDHS